jgi:hypothetical protein
MHTACLTFASPHVVYLAARAREPSHLANHAIQHVYLKPLYNIKPTSENVTTLLAAADPVFITNTCVPLDDWPA